MTTESSLINALPTHLAERLTPFSKGEQSGEFVLYWMRTALRDHENPALDTALCIARHLGLPAFVYQEVDDQDPYASDRHHAFVLECARDVARGLAARNIGYALHVPQAGQQPVSPLRDLSQKAALVVTEHLPIAVYDAETRRLAESCPAPVWCMDTACVVPMTLTDRAHTSLFRFREATKSARGDRVTRAWPSQSTGDTAFLPELDFEPIDIGQYSDSDIAELVARCQIDHGVAPVAHTRGGTSAGYARWQRFVSDVLPHYADRHHDPLARGTSRLSVHMHYGTVSPMRIAREAAELGGPGPEKFLEQLLGWRELSYHFCYHRPIHQPFDVLPDWARATWRKHESDTRPRLLSPEALERGQTGDGLWDAAQLELAIHGELHNDLRMMWGKALAQWTPTVDRAIDMAMELNHRYALDGRDPASYGGVLSCFGLFDRPTTPPSPITGLVRPRWSVEYSKPLDVVRYRATAMRASATNPPHVAIIGAGLAGLTCARTLRDHGLQVTVFEKSRGPGGRMSTRRVDEYRFDHGAQYFTARDPRFARRVASWSADGVVAPWPAHIVVLDDGVEPARGDDTRYVGAPRMSALTRHLARDVEVRYGVRVAEVKREAASWDLYDDNRVWLGAYDLLVVAVPGPQAASLLSHAPALADAVGTAEMAPCWAAMLRFDRPLKLEYDAAFNRRGAIAWLARDASKPGRPTGHETWVVHASIGWSQENLEAEPESVAERLAGELARVTGSTASVCWSTAHRWRHARVVKPVSGLDGAADPGDCLYDSESRLGVCGDYFRGPRLEDGFLSGLAMAGRILGTQHARASRAATRL